MRVDPVVSGDAQQRDPYVKRSPAGDRTKGAFTIWEVAGIFPKKVADKWIGSVTVASSAHEEMFQLSSDASCVENSIGSFCSLQVESDNIQSVAKHEVLGSGIPMYEHFLVFPHSGLSSPLVAQPI